MPFLEDKHVSLDWYAESHLHASVCFLGHDVEVRGMFRHRKCNRVSSSAQGFHDRIYNLCAEIPRLIDFRLRVLREDKSIVTRGC